MHGRGGHQGSHRGRLSLTPPCYRGARLDVGFVPKILLKICVKAADRDKAVEAIVKAARTGAVGDGKLFIYPIADVVRIRTGEVGETAI